MDYLIMREIAALVFMMTCIGFMFYSSIKFSRDVRDVATEHRDDMMELLRHTIDTLKSTSLEERVNAVALESQHEVQLEMLKDAYSQEKQEAEEKDPHYVHADDGTQINLNEYEVM
jgi:molybdopterin synthase catalytic subunit|tara:strand:- start:193 stop:540 length:348 start_codon:yes stop_codon:yes gene_type:complete